MPVNLEFGLLPSIKHHQGYILMSAAAGDPRWIKDALASVPRTNITLRVRFSWLGKTSRSNASQVRSG
jgi:hypothetical protein